MTILPIKSQGQNNYKRETILWNIFKLKTQMILVLSKLSKLFNIIYKLIMKKMRNYQTAYFYSIVFVISLDMMIYVKIYLKQRRKTRWFRTFMLLINIIISVILMQNMIFDL